MYNFLCLPNEMNKEIRNHLNPEDRVHLRSTCSHMYNSDIKFCTPKVILEFEERNDILNALGSTHKMWVRFLYDWASLEWNISLLPDEVIFKNNHHTKIIFKWEGKETFNSIVLPMTKDSPYTIINSDIRLNYNKEEYYNLINAFRALY